MVPLGLLVTLFWIIFYHNDNISIKISSVLMNPDFIDLNIIILSSKEIVHIKY